MNSITNKVYDVGIIGGGPTGLSLSRQLAFEGISVAVIEKSSPSSIRIGENLVPSIKSLLKNLGFWEPFLNLKARPIYGVHSSWGSKDLVFQPYIFQKESNGWQVDRSQFDAMLQDEAKKLGVDIFLQTELVGLSFHQDSDWLLKCRHDNSLFNIKARLLIDAGGRKSTVSQFLPYVRQPIDSMIGLAVKCFKSDYWYAHCKGSLILESSKNGWWYLSSQPDDSIMAVFLTDKDIWKGLNKDSSPWQTWQSELLRTKYIKQAISGNNRNREIYSFPAFSHLLKEIPKNSFLPIGDAHFSRDPLSGQGICRGLRAVQQSVPAILNFLKDDREALNSYIKMAQKQYRDYLATRRSYYAMEQRWSNNPFWKRRHKQSSNLKIEA